MYFEKLLDGWDFPKVSNSLFVSSCEYRGWGFVHDGAK